MSDIRAGRTSAGSAGLAPAEDHFDAPILNIFVTQRGQMPWVAARPFFILMFFGLDISLLALHFIQYACMGFSPRVSNTCGTRRFGTATQTH